jgi:hypothetical protein
MHKFKVGQRVRLSAAAIDRGSSGIYKVMAQLPEERGEHQYRVQSTTSPQQRVVIESRLTGVETL